MTQKKVKRRTKIVCTIGPATRSAKIIAITGYPSEENTARIKKAGAEMVFKKPFNYEKMEAAIYSLME